MNDTREKTMEPTGYINQIVETAKTDEQLHEFAPMKIGEGNWENELLLFVKPEIFMVADPQAMKNSLELVFAKLAEFNAQVDGMMLVGGKILEQYEIMNRHYGYINLISRKASEIIDPQDKQKVFEMLGISPADAGAYIVLGGHEYLKRYPVEDVYQLDKFWFTKKSVKLRSGFYFQAYDKGPDKIILVNGFHPVQLAHFTEPSHRILLVLVHSNTSWPALRDEMIGVTYPEKASPQSIRGVLYADPRKFGMSAVGIGNNGVHLSAGPFEGLFEIQNFLGSILKSDPKTNPPLLLKKMLAKGMSFDKAIGALKNPPVEVNGKTTDLFGATENIDSDPAIAVYAA
jgi:hypothetical protein